LVQVIYSDITFRGRTFVKDDLQDRHKDLCNEDTPVTDQLFGHDIKEKVKELDAEFSIERKIGKRNREPGERTRRSFVPNNRGGRGCNICILSTCNSVLILLTHVSFSDKSNPVPFVERFFCVFLLFEACLVLKKHLFCHYCRFSSSYM
jgi:hypothetical protein